MATPLRKKPSLLGAAVIGIALYGLFQTNKGKKARADIQKFVKEVIGKKKVLGKISETAYDEAVEMAGRLYKGSKKLTKKELDEVSRVIDDLKEQWKVDGKKKK